MHDESAFLALFSLLYEFISDATLTYFIWTLLVLGHELGHVAAGLMSGFQFRSVAVSLFHVSWTQDGFKLTIDSNPRAVIQGYTSMVPRHPHALSRRIFVFVAGGPLASAALSAAAFTMASHVNGRPKIAFFVAGILAGAMVVRSLAPSTNPETKVATDGQRLLWALRGDAKQVADFSKIWLMTLLEAGVEPMTVAAELAKLPERKNDPEITVRDYIELMIALESGNREAARSICARAFVPGTKVQGFASSFAYHFAMIEALTLGKRDLAEILLLQSRWSPDPDASWLLVESTVRELQGDRAKAESALEEWRMRLKNCKDSTLLESGTRWIVRDLTERFARKRSAVEVAATASAIAG